MLIHGPGLLVSLPASELRELVPSGSLLKATELRGIDLSPELTRALDLVRRACEVRKIPLRWVARPEIFTHGVALEWLKAQLGPIRDHLCISDGTAIRPIVGFRNHLFLYRLGIQHNARAFYRLRRCAPELLASMVSQINTCLSFGAECNNGASPTPVLLQEERLRTEPAKLYRYVTRSSPTESVKRTLKSPVAGHQWAAAGAAVTYVPLTDTACNDAEFLQQVVTAACSSIMLLRLPNLAAADTSTEERLSVAIEAIRPCFANLRRASVTVLFAGTDVPATVLSKLQSPVDLKVHSSFEYWAHPPEYYEVFRSIEVLEPRDTPHGPLSVEKLLTPAFGRKPVLRQLRAARGETALILGAKVTKQRGARRSPNATPSGVM